MEGEDSPYHSLGELSCLVYCDNVIMMRDTRRQTGDGAGPVGRSV